ncbi:PadR family transcriptional regulator [Dermacoccaceae bacterium W4C1]
MAAKDTRLLLLGAVQIFEPVNGYQIRRELMSWNVDEWAHINPGSIYNGLARLASEGNLQRHDLQDSGRTVAVYESTNAGRAEHAQLFAAALTEVDLYDAVSLNVALAILPQFPRAQVLDLLRQRAQALTEVATVIDDHLGDFPGTIAPAGAAREPAASRTGACRASLAERLHHHHRSRRAVLGGPVTCE